jgi:RHS repeat-associated protein
MKAKAVVSALFIGVVVTLLIKLTPTEAQSGLQPGDVIAAEQGLGQLVVIRSNGTKETLASGLQDPRGVALEADGNVIVVEASAGRITRVKTRQRSSETVRSGLNLPEGVAIDQQGRILVSVFRDGQVVRLSANGQQSETVAQGLNGPSGVAVAPTGEIYVAELSAGSLHRVSADGKTRTPITDGMRSPDLIAVASTGFVYVAEFGAGNIVEVNPRNGAKRIVKSGLRGPVGVAVGPASSTLSGVAQTQVELAAAAAGVESVYYPNNEGFQGTGGRIEETNLKSGNTTIRANVNNGAGCAVVFASMEMVSDDQSPNCMAGLLSGGPCGGTSVDKPLGLVQLDRGDEYYSVVDLSIPGRGFDWAHVRTYRSRAERETRQGFNWDFNYNTRLSFLASGDIVLFEGDRVRAEVYRLNPATGTYQTPAEYFTRLVQTMVDVGNTPQNPADDIPGFRVLDRSGTSLFFDLSGLLAFIEDRNGNRMEFFYEDLARPDLLTRVTDTMGRDIFYFYYDATDTNPGRRNRLREIEDFRGRSRRTRLPVTGQRGRVVRFDYDREGNLISATSPSVVGASTGNDFPQGKTETYTYSSGQTNPRLNHNLLTVTRPNENQSGAFGNPTVPDGTPLLMLRYNADDRVIRETYGYGTATYDYEFFGAPQPPARGVEINGQREPAEDPFVSRTTMTDRNGNITVYRINQAGAITGREELTNRNIRRNDGDGRTNDPDRFVTSWRHDENNQVVLAVFPEGTVIEYEYDRGVVSDTNNDGQPDFDVTGDGRVDSQDVIVDARLRANQIRQTRLPDTARGGDQTHLTRTILYEPVYNQPSVVIEERGNPSVRLRNGTMLVNQYAPPNGGAVSAARYAGRAFFDYQEGNTLVRLTQFLGDARASVLFDRTTRQLRALGLTQADQFSLGDLNGDGRVTTFIAGNVIRSVAPSVTLATEQTNQRMIEGGATQTITSEFRYNRFGQLVAAVDPEGNTSVFVYFNESDPNGDGSQTERSRLFGDSTTGGYLAAVISDVSYPTRLRQGVPATLLVDSGPASSRRREASAPANIQTNQFYDVVGNVIRSVDGRGNDVLFEVNELNQVASAQTQAPFRYVSQFFYDANNNLIQRNTEDRVAVLTDLRPTLAPGGPAPVNLMDKNAALNFTTARTQVNNTALAAPGAAAAGFFREVLTYDLLDNLIETKRDAIGSNPAVLTTQYFYDRNENLIQVIQPEGNVVNRQFDERDLLFRAGRGTRGISGAVLPNSRTFASDEFGTTAETSVVTYSYDGNRNLIQHVDSEANGEQAGGGDETAFVYDGFNRAIGTIDAVGNSSRVHYDPRSNAIRELAFGPTGGPTPTGVSPSSLIGAFRSGDGSVSSGERLADASFSLDERSRLYRVDRRLFLSATPPPGVTDRAALGREGSLTPGNGAVTTLVEFDRNSRRTFATEDDRDRTEWLYDGVSRIVESIDPEGNRALRVYDDNSNMIEARREERESGGGRSVASETFINTFEYDSRNRLIRTTDNVGNASLQVYDSRSNPTNRVDKNTNTSRVFYDGVNRRLAAIQDLRQDGRLTGDGSLAPQTLTGLAALGLAASQGLSDTGISRQWTWDGNSRLRQLADDNGNVTGYRYDALDRMIVQTSADGSRVTSAYDRDSNVIGVMDANGTVVMRHYDGINRLQTEMITRATGMADNANANPLLMNATRAVSVPFNVIGTTRVAYEYDGLSRLTRASDDNDPAKPEDDSEVIVDYDSLSRAIQQVQNGRRVSTLWANDREAVGLTYPNGRQINVTFDRLDRVDTIQDAQADGGRMIAAYDYIGAGRVLRRTYPNGTTLDFTAGGVSAYDALGRVVRERHTGVNGPASRVIGFEYGYDRENNKLFERKLHAPETSERYDYDSAYRLKSFDRGRMNPVTLAGGVVRSGDMRPTGQDFSAVPTVTAPATVGLATQRWTFDGLGNWLTQSVGKDDLMTANDVVETRRVNEVNEYTAMGEAGSSAGMMNHANPHDPNGNLIEDGVYRYRWDYRDRLREIRRMSDGDLVAVYAYDALNRRIFRAADADGNGSVETTVRYFYDGWRVIEEQAGLMFDQATVTPTDFDQPGTTLVQYVGGIFMDECLVMDRNRDGNASAVEAGKDQRLFYHHNAQYSVYGLTDEAGQLVEGYQYDSFGVQTVFQSGVAGGAVTFDAARDRVTVGSPMMDGAAGVGLAVASAVGNPYTYTGQRYDPEGHGQLYYKNRYYQPTRGRFLSRDPLGVSDGMSRYAYVGNNPANFVDPMGLEGLSVEDYKAMLGLDPDVITDLDIQEMDRQMAHMKRVLGEANGPRYIPPGSWRSEPPPPSRPSPRVKVPKDLSDLWNKLFGEDPKNVFLPGGQPTSPWGGPNPPQPGGSGVGGGRRFRSTLEVEEWKAKQRYIEWLREKGYEVPDRLLTGGPSTTGDAGGVGFPFGECMGHDVINIGGWQPSSDSDWNRDGQPDIVWRNETSIRIVIWMMDGASPVNSVKSNGGTRIGGGTWSLEAIDLDPSLTNGGQLEEWGLSLDGDTSIF